jgi:hypothetical protein
MRHLFALALIVVAAGMAGCGDGADPNYSTEVKMSEADKQREQELMAGQKAPGSAPERGGGAAGPSALTVPGKGGK